MIGTRPHRFPLSALSFALLSTAALSSTGPDPNSPVALAPDQEAWISGTVLSIDARNRTAEIAVESLRLLDGTVKGFGRPQRQTVELPQNVRISYYNSPRRWLPLQELAVNAPVSLTVVGSSRPELWLGNSVLISRPDPLRPESARILPVGSHPVEPDRVTMEPVTVPMVFPMLGNVRWSNTFLASRGGGTRRHRGQDLFAPKMTPLVACFDGVIAVSTGSGNAGNTVTIKGDNGWTAQYYHLNNDRPGTNDGQGTADFCFAPGIVNGARVYAGQLLGYNGDSGNAEGTTPHLHFELWNQELNACFDATASLQAAIKLTQPVLHAPFPEINAGTGMVRYEGYVRSFDPAQNQLVLDLVAAIDGNGAPQPVPPASRRTLRSPELPRFLRLETGELVTLASLRPHDRITVFAEANPTDNAQNLARAWVAESAPVLTLDSRTSTDELQTATDQFRSYASRSVTAHAEQLLIAINEYRQKKGLTSLTVSPQLCEAALVHSVSMHQNEYFDVLDLRSGMTADDRANQFGFNGLVRSRVYSSPNLEQLAKKLIETEKSLLDNPNLKAVGLGYVYAPVDPGPVNARHYWTLLLH